MKDFLMEDCRRLNSCLIIEVEKLHNITKLNGETDYCCVLCLKYTGCTVIKTTGVNM